MSFNKDIRRKLFAIILTAGLAVTSIGGAVLADETTEATVPAASEESVETKDLSAYSFDNV